MKPSRNVSISLICAALLMPLTIFVGKVVEYTLKSTNPSGVNILSELAYLAPILVSTIIVYVIVLLVGLVCGLLALRSPDKQFAKLSLGLLTIEVIVTILILVLQQATKTLG